MSESNPFQFKRKDVVDEPGIVGATWWNVAVENAATKESRRTVLKWLAVSGGVLAAFGIIAASVESESENGESQLQPALDMQRDYGWRFGATDEYLVLDANDLVRVSATDVSALSTVLAPKNPKLAPYALRTLLESPEARPRKVLAEPEEAVFVPLLEALKRPVVPVTSTYTASAQRYLAALGGPGSGVVPSAPSSSPGAGGVFGAPPPAAPAAPAPPANSEPSAVRGDRPPLREALVVDLPGGATVRFAAGLASMFEPVLLFDNWPHPRGIVPSHDALIAMLSLVEVFKEAKAKRADDAPPMFLLGSERLAPYTEGAEQFDNRYVAKLPDVASLQALGITRVTYVTLARNSPVEAEDLHEDFVAYAAAGIELRSILASMAEPMVTAHTFKPTPRTTAHGKGRSRQAAFGTVPVLVAVGTGIVLGSAFRRSGSRNRSGFSFGGG
jgi:hypothetical protein